MGDHSLTIAGFGGGRGGVVCPLGMKMRGIEN